MTAKDIISRDAFKRLTVDLARRLLAIDGEVIGLLETQNQRIEDRRADLVARMRSSDGKEFLLHIEIMNNNSTNMPYRMLRYYTRHTWIFRRDARLSRPSVVLRLVAIGLAIPPRRALLSGTINVPRFPQNPCATGIYGYLLGWTARADPAVPHLVVVIFNW